MVHRPSLVRFFRGLADARRLTVLVLVADNHGWTGDQLAVRLGWKAQEVRRHLKELKYGGVCESFRDGAVMRWYVNERLPHDLLAAVMRQARSTEPAKVLDPDA